MGMSHTAAELQAARLSPRVQESAKLERGHARGRTASAKADCTDVGLRGVPVIGHGSGAISGTSPGGELGAGARLEQAGRELLRAHRNRFKAKTA